MANFLTNLFSSGASSLVKAVGDAIDKNITSDEERKDLENEIEKARLNYDVEMKGLGITQEKAYLKDTSSARDNQSRVQESEEAGLLAKNVHSILALVIVGLTFFLYYWLILGEVDPTKKDIIIYILGALTTISTQVVAYFFGSSKGSKEKQKIISELHKNLKV
ncbi:MAG: hypothetical protein DRG78_18700 [Epsilonproteobacteria bacterium]|nr:MAG: hypothetical protein DRG78_18700 [Campylobacterota bacterium]